MSFEVTTLINGNEVDALKLFQDAASSGRPNLAIEMLAVILPALISEVERLTANEDNNKAELAVASADPTPTPAKRTAKVKAETVDAGTDTDVHS